MGEGIGHGESATGDWRSGVGFGFGDGLAGGWGVAVLPRARQAIKPVPFSVRTVGMTNGFLGFPNEAAPESGLLLLISTDAEGTIGVEVSMGYVDPATGVLTVMEQTAVFAVENAIE